MSPLWVVVRIVILILAFLVLIALFSFVLKLAFMVAALVGIAICLLASYFVFKKLFVSRSGSSPSDSRSSDTKLHSHDGQVRLFKEEPRVHELVDRSGGQLPATLSISVPDAVEVSVLSETDIAFRIKIKTGEHKGKVGWVDKASVTGFDGKRT